MGGGRGEKEKRLQPLAVCVCVSVCEWLVSGRGHAKRLRGSNIVAATKAVSQERLSHKFCPPPPPSYLQPPVTTTAPPTAISPTSLPYSPRHHKEQNGWTDVGIVMQNTSLIPLPSPRPAPPPSPPRQKLNPAAPPVIARSSLPAS